MADFLEAYILNLNQVTHQLQSSVLIEGYEAEKQTGFSKVVETAKKFIKKIQDKETKKTERFETRSRIG